jgi:hypothetical protein
MTHYPNDPAPAGQSPLSGLARLLLALAEQGEAEAQTPLSAVPDCTRAARAEPAAAGNNRGEK